jgi:hypothetical protein
MNRIRPLLSSSYIFAYQPIVPFICSPPLTTLSWCLGLQSWTPFLSPLHSLPPMSPGTQPVKYVPMSLHLFCPLLGPHFLWNAVIASNFILSVRYICTLLPIMSSRQTLALYSLLYWFYSSSWNETLMKCLVAILQQVLGIIGEPRD